MRSSPFLVALSFAASSLAWSQRPPPTQPGEHAGPPYRQPTQAEIEAAQKKYRMPTDDELARAAASHSTVNVEAIPTPQGPVDIEALTQRYERNRQAFETGYSADQPALLVFVTLGMPQPTLRALMDQAQRCDAVLVLRGLKSASLRETAARIRELMGERQVEWRIDPQAFDRFGVSQAPTFVLVKAGGLTRDCEAAACMRGQAYASVSGDVSLDYALEAIERRAPRFGPEVRRFLNRIRGPS